MPLKPVFKLPIAHDTETNSAHRKFSRTCAMESYHPSPGIQATPGQQNACTTDHKPPRGASSGRLVQPRRPMGGSFAHILLLLSLMLGAQATNSEVADCTPFGKAAQQCNFVGTSRKPLGLPQADWAMPGTSFAEVRPVDHSPYHAGQSGRWAVSIPPENQVNTQPWDDISFMAVGSRHRLTPAPPVAVFDNPAAALILTKKSSQTPPLQSQRTLIVRIQIGSCLHYLPRMGR